MPTYEAQRDKLTGKAVVYAIDFPDLLTRFVTDSKAPGVSNPVGWTLFDGVIVRKEDGASYDYRGGRLKVGGQSFEVPDLDETVTAWLTAHDEVDLAQARVTFRSGFRDVAEAEWPTQELVMEDYQVSGRAGGGYRFILGNVLAAMGASLFESIGGSKTSLAELSHPAGLDPGATEIVLDEEPEDWPASGFAILADEKARFQELISYATIGRQGLLWKLEGVVRRVDGVGTSGATGYTFPGTQGDTQIVPVWKLRGGVGELAFRVLTTTAAAGASIPAPQGSNPFLEDWVSSTNLEDWGEATTGGTVNREISDHLVGFSSVRFDRTGAGVLNINRTLDVTLEPGKWYILSVLFKASEALGVDGLEMRVRNITQTLDLDTDGGGETWVAGTRWHQFQAGTDTRRATIVFKWDAGFPGSDDTVLIIRHGDEATSPSSLFVDVGPTALFRGPYDSKPNGPYDEGDGNGLGLDIAYMGIDFSEDILGVYWPHPTFTASGATDTGAAALFVEDKKMPNVRTWVEGLLRSFGFRPVVDNLGRWTIDKLYLVPPTNVVIGKEWRSGRFRPSRWKRGLPKAVNSVSFGTDWDLIEGKYNRNPPDSVDQTSVSAFGKSEPVELQTRGLRTGRLGFPNLDGATIVTKGATRVLLELANPSSPFEIEAFLKFKDVSLLNTVTVIVPGIPDQDTGARQTTAKTFHVLRVSVDGSKGFVKLQLRERRVLNRPAIVGGNDLAGVVYSAATEAQRQFCFVAPDAGGFPSDSSTPYTVPP